jgi:hypothetical protein
MDGHLTKRCSRPAKKPLQTAVCAPGEHSLESGNAAVAGS